MLQWKCRDAAAAEALAQVRVLLCRKLQQSQKCGLFVAKRKRSVYWKLKTTQAGRNTSEMFVGKAAVVREAHSLGVGHTDLPGVDTSRQGAGSCGQQLTSAVAA